MYRVNIDKPTRRARVHKSTCDSIPDRVKDKKNGHWKSFPEADSAFAYAARYDRPNWDVGPCGLCEPNQPNVTIIATANYSVST